MKVEPNIIEVKNYLDEYNALWDKYKKGDIVHTEYSHIIQMLNLDTSNLKKDYEKYFQLIREKGIKVNRAKLNSGLQGMYEEHKRVLSIMEDSPIELQGLKHLFNKMDIDTKDINMSKYKIFINYTGESIRDVLKELGSSNDVNERSDVKKDEEYVKIEDTSSKNLTKALYAGEIISNDNIFKYLIDMSDIDYIIKNGYYKLAEMIYDKKYFSENTYVSLSVKYNNLEVLKYVNPQNRYAESYILEGIIEHDNAGMLRYMKEDRGCIIINKGRLLEFMIIAYDAMECFSYLNDNMNITLKKGDVYRMSDESKIKTFINKNPECEGHLLR